MSKARFMTNSERAKKASKERWHPTIPRATHSGVLIIGGQEIACDVLGDGRRILRNAAFSKAMGKSKTSGEDTKRALDLKIPIFLSANNLSPYLGKTISERGQQVFYKGVDGRKLLGYEACILPEACKIYVQAENDSVLMKQQISIAQVCKSMLYALATVGITALVDECTGFQEVRDRNELQIILENYISEELRSWTKKFPNEFFKQIYRIYGWEYPKIGNHPQCIGTFINKYIYGKLPEGVLQELKNKNPCNVNKIRKYKHHQFLTDDIGDDNLKKQIVQVITVMKLSNNTEEFKVMIERI